MKPWVKKLAIVLGIIASIFVISSSVKTWVDEKKTDTTTQTEQSQLLSEAA